MQFLKCFKDDTILWFIILFVLLFFCGNCGRMNDYDDCERSDYDRNNCGCCD